MVLVTITLSSLSPSDLIDLTRQFSSSFSKEKSLVSVRADTGELNTSLRRCLELEIKNKLYSDVADPWSARNW